MPEGAVSSARPNGWRPWRLAWAEALYGDDGFYRRSEGPTGHFETSANAGGGVRELLAEALVELAYRHGCRQVVDIGAGRGELLAALAGAHGAPGSPMGQSPRPPLRLTGVDVVPRPAGLPDAIHWLEAPGGAHLPDQLADLDAALVVAHEWLDVVPGQVLEVDQDGDLRVVEVDPTGAERLGAVPDPESLAWAAAWWPTTRAPAGARVEVGLTRDRAWANLVGRVRTGVVVAIDYGHEAGGRPPAGTLAAHRAGRLVPPVPDGGCDLTADVAWDSVRAATPATPGSGEGRLVTQRVALTELGVDGARPVLGGDPAAYLTALHRASAAATLLDPGGLGGLSWLIQPVGPPLADWTG